MVARDEWPFFLPDKNFPLSQLFYNQVMTLSGSQVKSGIIQRLKAMKKVFLVLAMTTGVLLFTSCNQRSNNATVEEVPVDRVRVDTPDNIVTDSVTDAKGNKMYLAFNNTRGLVDIRYKGEHATLTQDTTASGIRFRNSQYVYEEWQGKITLKKDGRIVFDNQK